MDNIVWCCKRRCDMVSIEENLRHFCWAKTFVHWRALLCFTNQIKAMGASNPRVVNMSQMTSLGASSGNGPHVAAKKKIRPKSKRC